MDNRPIGVFDSGLGGLTAVKALRRLLPGEDLIYFGDTARVPYGGRSRETLLKYARCNSIEPLVRSNAFRTELLSDPVTVDSSSLPYHVYVDVYRSYRIALQDEEVEPSVPYR